MIRKLQVFISSTFTDMHEERQAAVEAVLSKGHIPAGMELFTAGDESQLNVIKKWIDESDIYLLILGGRYGTIDPKSGKSYIQLEYEYAVNSKKPYFAVVITERALDIKVEKYGKTVLELNNPGLLNEFTTTVKSKMCSFYEDIKDIKLSIFSTLSDFEKRSELSGWISGKDIKKSEEYCDEIIKLTNENKILQQRFDILEKRYNESKSSSKKESISNLKTLHDDNFQNRVNRIIKLIHAEKRLTTFNNLTYKKNGQVYEISDPYGKFEYYFVYKQNNITCSDDERYIKYLMVLSIDSYSDNNIYSLLADIRVMLQQHSKDIGKIKYKYIIASKQINDDLKPEFNSFFEMALSKLKIRNKDLFSLEIWNDDKLSKLEEEFVLKLPEENIK